MTLRELIELGAHYSSLKRADRASIEDALRGEGEPTPAANKWLDRVDEAGVYVDIDPTPILFHNHTKFDKCGAKCPVGHG